ncbi:MAG: glycosyltransferase family 39 protein [Gemmataceae bacterium]|nr:glycosyltransferase family 39 protein [Gemmataceae bacterium]MCI0738393.1 glycosyltransferase family 39 protein [Gemmataceae bacterium]
MDECEAKSAIDRPRGDWRLIGLLFLLVLPLRGWLLWNAEVAARDSIGYIRYALHFEQYSWSEVLLKHNQHPGYAGVLWLVSQPVRALWGTDADTMQLAARLTSTLGALVLLLPSYFLGKELLGRRAGFWGALIFQYLPVSGHHLSDGVSESWFLVWTVSALWLGVVAVKKSSPAYFAWCGICAGAAYLTRPEGALVGLSAGLLLLGMQLKTSWRLPWRRWLVCGLALSCSAAAVAGIYVLSTGKITNKITPGLILDNFRPDPALFNRADEPRLLFASIFGATFSPSDDILLRWTRSLRALGVELMHGFHYFGIVPVAIGLGWQGRRLTRAAWFWLPAGYVLIHATILALLGMTVFYISDRHLMQVILLGCYFLALGLARVGTWFEARWKMATTALLAGFVLVCLPKTAERLHANREGNVAAGRWLQAQREPGDMIEDDHAYSHYYAGMVFEEGRDLDLPKHARPTSFWVLTRSSDARVGAEREQIESELRGKGRLVYHWPPEREPQKARVVVYAVPRK